MENETYFEIKDNPEKTAILLKKPVEVSRYLELYTKVGKNWNWTDRLLMDPNELYKLINSPENEIYVFHFRGKEVGYVELVHKNKYIEIQYFGLFTEFIGKGLGKYFFSWVINKAWSYKPEFLQLDTCGLDHENALELYKSLGFKEYRKKIENKRIFIK